MTNPVLSVEARKWSRIEKYVGLSGLIEGVMGKKMGLKEEFRKPTTFHGRDYRELWHQSFRKECSTWSADVLWQNNRI